jgi:small glutamine-rich tetratricopeptide repeat-containing protein alpha
LESKKRLALAIIDFLNKSLKDGTLSADDADSIEIAQNCIAESFHVDPTDEAALRDAVGSGQDLMSIYGVYERLRKRGDSAPASRAAPASPAGAASSSARAATSTPPPAYSSVNPVQKAEAEKLKSQGNAAMSSKDYPTAIKQYTAAIAIDPQNAIYLSNRAAAYSASNQQDKAVADAQAAVDIDPKYTKAWSRLGLAKYALGDNEGSMNAYAKGIEAEGNGGSDAMKKGYETARRRLDDGDSGASSPPVASRGVPSPPPAGAGGMPDLSALAGMLGGAGGGAGGGMPDFGSLMSNPMFANMAQSVMSNPDLMNSIMSNPSLQRMAEGAQQGGGVPDLNSLMSDPSIAEM